MWSVHAVGRVVAARHKQHGVRFARDKLADTIEHVSGPVAADGVVEDAVVLHVGSHQCPAKKSPENWRHHVSVPTA